MPYEGTHGHGPDESDLPDDRAPEEFERVLLGRPASMGRRQVSRGAGVSVRSARKFWHAMGFPIVQEGDDMFTEADLEALARVARLVREGEFPEEFALSMTRALARTMDRLAAWQAQLVLEEVSRQRHGDDEPTEEEAIGDSEVAAAWLSGLADDLEPLLLYVWRRQLTATIQRLLSVEEEAGRMSVIGFADLVNFTSVVRRLTERDLARLVQRFEDLCTDIVTAHGGRVVKTVGDEVLFQTFEVAPAAAIALDLVEAMTEDDLLPEARIGMAHGPVVRRLGDVFGTTVNRASRLTSVAPPGGVYVDDALTRLLEPLSGFAAVPTRRRSLRGIGEVVPSRLVRVRGARRTADVTAHV
ncbi:adenylate/guanylate cyclase domain-containing protein [Janibacter sp. DB-40]|uniref:adenylate/guanylate cyclase domain-containing protein n=1 Tax=Janibacter sp. DB-40 TaxID=3028808 RepID=UPI002406924F|nr:adenylate/guanylate cyclase domain-containing protein [Janibacter sp. DB-40]